jgi:hypothetical protein
MRIRCAKEAKKFSLGLARQLAGQMLGNPVAELRQNRELTPCWLLTLGVLLHHRALCQETESNANARFFRRPSCYGMAVTPS